MKKFRVFVRGENFRLNLEGAVKRYGFYTTRFVEAPDKSEAERLAIDLLRQESRLCGRVVNDQADPPMLFAEEIDEIVSFDTVENRFPGLAFYEDQPVTH